jgi:hypothetical protein
MIEALQGLRLPWIACVSGDYDLPNVARSWTLGWESLNDCLRSDNFPQACPESSKSVRYPKIIPGVNGLFGTSGLG